MNPIDLTAAPTPGTWRPDRKENRAELRKRRHSDSEPGQPLHKRQCKHSNSCSDLSRLSGEDTDNTAFSRDRFGSKGLYLKLMQDACLPVPPFECVDTGILNAIEKRPMDLRPLKDYLPDGMPNMEETFYGSKHSLVEMKTWISQLPPTDRVNRGQWLDSLSAFIASDAFYQQVRDSYAAREIRTCHQKLNSPFKPVIVRSSGVAEDHFADVRTGKYQSIVHGEADIVRTCLKVMASSYCSRGCPQGVPQPMAIILQECINCSFGGVAISSLQDKVIRVEYVPGQPKGAVTGRSDMKPHCYIIKRDEGQMISAAFTPGNISATFVLEKVDGESGFREVKKAKGASVHGYDELGDDIVKNLHRNIAQLEKLLCSPVQVEFGINQQGRLFLLQVVIPRPGILDLPTEIITKVISMLPMKDIKNCKVTCKHINKIINSNYLVETCWFNKFPGIMQKEITTVFNRENYESDLRSWIQRFDNNLPANIFDEMKWFNNFPTNLSFYVARTLTEAPRLKLVEKATFDHKGSVIPDTLSLDGRHLQINSDNFNTKLASLNSQGGWVLTGTIEHVEHDHKGWTETCFSSDSRHLVVFSHGDGKVELYSLDSHKMWIKNDIIGSESDVPASSATFSPDSRYLLITSKLGKATLYSLNSLGLWAQNAIITSDIGSSDVSRIIFSTDGCHLVIVSVFGHNKATLYSLNSSGLWKKSSINELGHKVSNVTFSPDSRNLIVPEAYGKATLYSLNGLGEWTENAIINKLGDGGCNIIFSRDSRHVMIDSHSGLRLCSLNSHGMWENNIIDVVNNGINVNTDFSPDGHHLMITTCNKDIKLFSLNSQGGWTNNGIFKLYGWFDSFKFSPDSRHVVVASSGYAYIESKLISLNRQGVWVEEDIIKNSCTERFCRPCHKPQPHAIHFSPQGCPLVFTFCRCVAKLITLNRRGKWAEKATIEDVRFDSAIFSPEGRHLVATNRNEKKVHVFEILP